MVDQGPGPRALISTIQPTSGGVPAKLRWLVQELQALGIAPTIAWYEPWSVSPRLSIPLRRLGSALLQGQRPGLQRQELWPGVPGVGIGSWLPELEFTHYQPHRHWRQLILAADLHIAVTGNPLCAHRFLASGVPFLAWIGTPWHGDRVDRVRQFPAHRRLLDAAVNSPVLRRQERRVLQSQQGHLLTISRRTAQELEQLSGRPVAGVLYLPPDPELFHPDPAARVPWRIGFSGRYSDPRKQLPLLLDALALLVRQGHPVQLELTGERAGHPLISQALAARGLLAHVRCHPYLQPAELARVIQRWDLFVIPSHQEGLCIAALEAMACGVPVVSTRCGGPEDFVIPGQTGTLVPHAAAAMAAAISQICGDAPQRQRLSAGALAWIAAHADATEARRRFRQHLRAVYPALLIPDS
ncbi:glycosyltransferase [Cyanobium sp. BA5m-21]|uniref:glycosyltransferase n=1 Tax=unclassified Cyanobium TaxID=2627006 RepID=UPI0020CF28F6|nr:MULTISPECIES: glycosyltransferase [unclassified Cyanobium]MCP9903255.1 glycosyltransferase [Cyanobium sp. BA5m-10]MCP9907935.1 glycosyltransferase [Cyanobium sp. BA5m-21]